MSTSINRSLGIALVALFICSPVLGQSTTDGSIYSRFGLGELRTFSSSRSQAMGGGGYAQSSFNHINLANPATLSDQMFMRVAGGIQFEGYRTTDATGAESKLSSGYMSGVLVSFPILQGKLGVGLSFAPYSRVGYRVEVERSVDLGDADPVNYTSVFRGNGGLQRAGFGIGYRPNTRIAFGLSTQVIFGLLEDGQRTTFNNELYTDANLVTTTRLSGFGATAGVRASFPGFLTEQGFLALGATVTLPSTLSGERTLTVGEIAEPDTLSAGLHGDTRLPLGVAVGVSYQPDARWTLSADALFEGWSAFESDFAFPGYDPAGVSATSDRVRLSAGVEFFPGARDLVSRFLRRTSYRLGTYFEQAYISPDPTKRLHTLGVTGGLSLPTLIPGTRVDINVEVGSRGSESGAFVRDRFLRLGLHFNFAERWFLRRRLG